MRRLGTMGLVCVAGAGLNAIPARAQDAVVLRMTPPAGQVVHYRTDMQMWSAMMGGMPSMAPQDSNTPAMVQTIFTTRTVTAVEGDVRVITTVIDSSTMDMPGMPPQMRGMMGGQQNMLRGMTSVQRVDSRGRTLSNETTQQPEALQQLGRMGRGGMMGGGGNMGGRGQSYALPEGPVRVGETWTVTDSTQLPGGPGRQATAPVQMTYRLERIERQGGPAS